MKQFEYTLRVRYSETDKMGVVYYGNYPQYLEVARVEWLRAIGIEYSKMEEEGVMLPVVSLHIDYKKPAFYDELITIKVVLKNKPTNKIEFDYEIYNAKGELLSTAHTILVFVDAHSWKVIRCPQAVLDCIERTSEEC